MVRVIGWSALGALGLVWVLVLTVVVGVVPRALGLDDTSSPPVPVPTTAPSRYGAPVIEVPRDLRGPGSAPCERLLTRRQIEDLGYPATGRFRMSLDYAPECKWIDDRTIWSSWHSLSVSVWIGEDLFVDTYRNRVLPIFRPISLDGLPAVEGQDPGLMSSCTITVGVADEQSLNIDVDAGPPRHDGEPAEDPCAQGRRAGELILRALRPLPR